MNSPDLDGLERFSFGDNPELADELLALVLAGVKTATCWSIRDGQQTHVGKRMVVCDGAGQPRAVLETVSLEKQRYCDVDATFAYDEGEGDRSLTDWHEGHRIYFERTGGFDEDMLLWCERFRVIEVL